MPSSDSLDQLAELVVEDLDHAAGGGGVLLGGAGGVDREVAPSVPCHPGETYDAACAGVLEQLGEGLYGLGRDRVVHQLEQLAHAEEPYRCMVS
jgi:hypothetical protein